MDKETPSVLQEVFIEPLRAALSFEFVGVMAWNLFVILVLIWSVYRVSKPFHKFISERITEIIERRSIFWWERFVPLLKGAKGKVTFVCFVLIAYILSLYTTTLIDGIERLTVVVVVLIIATSVLRGVNTHFVPMAREHFGKKPYWYPLYAEAIKLAVVYMTVWAILMVFSFEVEELFNLNISPTIVALVSTVVLSSWFKRLWSAWTLASSKECDFDDYVTIGSHTGTFVDATLRKTFLSGSSGEIIGIPNKEVVDCTVTNYSKKDSNRVDWMFYIDVLDTNVDDLVQLHEDFEQVIAKNKVCVKSSCRYESQVPGAHRLHVLFNINLIDIDAVDSVKTEMYVAFEKAVKLNNLKIALAFMQHSVSA